MLLSPEDPMEVQVGILQWGLCMRTGVQNSFLTDTHEAWRWALCR